MNDSGAIQVVDIHCGAGPELKLSCITKVVT